MTSPDRSSSSKQGQKTPQLKLPLLELKNVTVRYSKSASFSDTRSRPSYGYQDNTDGGLPMRSMTSSFSDTWPQPSYRLQDNICPKKGERCKNKAEDTNIKGTELPYSYSYTGKASVKEAKYHDNQIEKRTSEGVEDTTMNTKTKASNSMGYGESLQEAGMKELEAADERLSLLPDGGAPMKRKPLSKFVDQIKSEYETQSFKDNKGSLIQSTKGVIGLSEQKLPHGTKSVKEMLELDTGELEKRHEDEVEKDRGRGCLASFSQNCDKNEILRLQSAAASAAESSERETEGKRTSKINPNLVMVGGRNSEEKKLTNIVNKVNGLEPKQKEIERTDVTGLHLQNDEQNVVKGQQTDGCIQGHKNRGIAGMMTESLDRQTHRSSNREDDALEHIQTHYEIKIYEKNDLLCLLHKHPFDIKGNVKIKVDLQQGYLLMSGVNEIDVKEVENSVNGKLADVRTEMVVIPEYQVLFVQKERVQRLINETLDQRHIFCYWRLDKRYIYITAWGNGAIAGWFTVYKELFHVKELKICHDQEANMKLVHLYRSHCWKVVKNSIIGKCGDLFSVGEFNKDWQRYLGIIAPVRIFDKIWSEIEIELKMFRPPKNALLHSKQMPQIENIPETSSESHENIEEDKSIVQKKNEFRFTGEDQTEQQAENDTVGDGPPDSIIEQVQPTDSVQTFNTNNQGKTKTTEDDTAVQHSNSGKAVQIKNSNLKKWYLGKDSEHQHVNEKQVGEKAIGLLDCDSDTDLQKYKEHGFEGVKETQQVKVSKVTDTVRGAGDTSKGRISNRGQLHLGQRANQSKDNDIELEAASGPLHTPLSGEYVGQQETRSEDANDKPELETQHEDAESKTARIKDTDTVHIAGNIFKDKVEATGQVGQVSGCNDNKMELEVATGSFHTSSIFEQNEKKTSREDFFDQNEGERQYEDVESYTAKTKGSHTISGAGSTSKGRSRDRRRVGQKENLTMADETEHEAGKGSFHKPVLSEHDKQQATRYGDISDLLELQKQQKDHELKIAERQVGKNVNQDKNDKMDLQAGKEPLLSGNNDQQKERSEDSDIRLEVETHGRQQVTERKDDKMKLKAEGFYVKLQDDTEHKGAELKSAVIKDSTTVSEAGVTSEGRIRVERQVEHNVTQKEDDKMDLEAGNESILSGNDGQQTERSKDSDDRLEVETQHRAAESKKAKLTGHSIDVEKKLEASTVAAGESPNTVTRESAEVRLKECKEITLRTLADHEIQCWKFAFTCETVHKRICDFFNTEIKLTDEGHVQAKQLINNLDEQAVRDAVTGFSRDVKEKVFIFNSEYLEEVEEDFDQLRRRKVTKNWHVNPYENRNAQISIVKGEGTSKVFLLALDIYFGTCCKDVEHILKKYQNANNETEEGTNFQEKKQCEKSIQCEKWKFDHLRKTVQDISKYEKDCNLMIKLEGEDQVLVTGRDPVKVTEVITKLGRLIKVFVKIVPSPDDLHVWKFAFSCPEVNEKIKGNIPGTVSENLIHCSGDDDSSLIIKFFNEENIMNEQEVRAVISEGCQNVRKKTFTTTRDVEDDIKKAINNFKELIPKENPFSLDRAKVFLLAENSEYKIILVTLKNYFEQCCDLIDKVIDGDMVNAEADCDDADGKHPDYEENNISERLKKLPALSSASINCEKWKFDCLTKIDNIKDKLEKKFNVSIEMKDERTLLVKGKDQKNVKQAGTDLRHTLKQLTKDIQTITEESYENLDADQNYRDRIGAFENRNQVVVELGKVLDFEPDVVMRVDGLDVILTKNIRTKGLLIAELIKADHGVRCLVRKEEIPWKNLNELTNKLMKLNTEGMVILLDNYVGQIIELTNFLSDVITCVQEYTAKGAMYTLYICTGIHEKFYGMKELLQKFYQPVRDVVRPKRDQAISIEVIKGELAKQRVDVIINSSNTNLQLDQGAVSRSILNVAGEEMQIKIRKTYPYGIRPGEIAETKGYRLNAHHVFHSCLSTWNIHVPKNNEICQKHLHQIVRKSLERTEQLHQTTIAFPALGTGVLKFPREVVATEMISTVLSYSRENPQTCIQKVFFVIHPNDQSLYKVFAQTFENLISASKMPGKADENMKYCVVISGRKEHVTKAKAVIQEELLQPTDISGNSQIRAHTQNVNKGPLNAGHHAQSQGSEPATHTGQTSNMAARVADTTMHVEMANNQIHSYEQSNRKEETDEPKAENFDPDPTYDTIGAVTAGLTPDKGAIPKRPNWDRKGKQHLSSERFEDPGSDDNSKDENSPEINMRIKTEKRKEVDPSCDTALDKYLEQITVSLDEKFVSDLQGTKLDDMMETIDKHWVEINLKECTLSGKARDLAAVEKVVRGIINGNRYVEKLEKSSDDNDDVEYENLDPGLEDSITEKTLSQRFSTEVQQKQLKNVRREAFVLMKILYETELKEYGRDCQVEFSGIDLTLHGKDHETLGKVYQFVKQSLTQLDDYYYRELDPTKPVHNIMEVAMQIKSQAKGKWDNIYVFEDDGMVRIAGSSFEHVDEFRQVVEVRLSGNQPSSRANRKFDAKVDDRFDNKNSSSTFTGKLKNAIQRGDRSGQPATYKVFHTDEGIKIYVYKANILHLPVDCIVNAANSSLTHGGGIAKVIAQAAGNSFEKESRNYIATYGYLKVGSSCVTTAGKLSYKCVIHTVGPNISDYRKDEMKKLNKDLFDAIYTCLDQAKTNQLQSIGIPSVSSGVFGVPKKWCALQYCLAAEDFSQKNSNCCLKEIHFIDIDEEMLDVINLACKTVFLHSKTAKKELEKLKCSQNKHKKVRVLKFLKGKKSIAKKNAKNVYPRIVPAVKSKLKIEVSTGLSVAIIKGKITDFRKGVIVCPQDPELRCEEEVAVAIQKDEIYYQGNLWKKYGKQKRAYGEVLVIGSKCFDCSFIYNVVVPQKMIILDTLCHCYTQVLQKAEEDKIEKIAVPLFLTDSKKHVEKCAQILMNVLIHMVNTKGKHHIFPSVYIYNDDHDAVQIVIDVMKKRLLEESKTGLERNPVDEDQKSIYHTPPTSPVPTTRHQVERQVSATSQESGMLDDRTPNISEEVVGDGDNAYETMSLEQHGERRSHKGGDSAESMKCVICIDFFTNPKTLMKCGHTFCTDCIEQCFKVKPVCPVCSTPYGILTGTQPAGEMRTVEYRFTSLPGYKGCGYTQINYHFPDGIQEEGHPNPGKRYSGTRRTAYLPDNPEGQKVLKLLKVAFDRKLIFTIGRSVTTGTENIVTWNDIHHKTKMFGGPENYGYPDPDYLKRVTAELEVKGVTENDID